MKRLSLILLMGMMATAGTASADIYKWTDDAGGVHFTDNLDKVPVKHKKNVQKMEVTPVIEKTERQPAQPAVAPGSTGAASLYGGHDESWWRSRFAALRNEIKVIQDALPDKREQFTIRHRKYVIYSKPRDRVASNEINAEIKKDEARIEELQKQLADLDSEASKAGVPMDWRR